MADDKKPGTESTDPEKDKMLSGEGDAAAALEDLGSEMLPTISADEPDVIESTDTETETVDDEKTDTETETVDDDDNPDLAQLREYGLEKLYPSIPAALAGAKEKERFVEDQRLTIQQNQQSMQNMSTALDRLAQNRPQQTSVAPSPEVFAELMESNPQAAVAQMGFLTREQGNYLVERLNEQGVRLDQNAENAERKEFAGALSDLEGLADVAAHFQTNKTPPPTGQNKLWDTMFALYNNTSSLKAAGGWPSDALPLLYTAAKQQLVTGPPIPKVSDKRKRGATTTSGGRSKPRSDDLPNWDEMNSKEIFAWHQKQGLTT